MYAHGIEAGKTSMEPAQARTHAQIQTLALSSSTIPEDISLACALYERTEITCVFLKTATSRS